MKNILVLDAQNINSLAVTRELGKQGYTIGNLGNSNLSLSFFSRYSSRKHIVDRFLPSNLYVKKILKLAKDFNYELIIPLSLKSYNQLSKNRNLIDNSVKLILPPKKSMDIASSKPKTFEFAKKLKIPIPHTLRINKKNIIEMVDFVKKVGFPIVIKGSIGGTNNLRYCNKVSDLYNAVKGLLKKEKTVICQEYITGPTNGFYSYYKQGKMKAFFMHQRIKQYPLTGGPSSVARSYKDKKLLDISCQILNKLKWNGPVMIEYKLDSKSGQYKLIEINPKLWGSLDLTIKSGINIPQIIIKDVMGERISLVKDYKDIYFRWIFPNDFLHFFASNLVEDNFEKNIPIFNNVDRSDFLPSVFQIFQSITKLIILLIKGKLRYPSGKPNL